MAERHIIDMETWPRREHYRYFGNLDDPYFGIAAKADFTSCYLQARQDGESFFLYSLHRILRAVNAVAEFRYRIEDGGVVLYDIVGASPTIGREDGSFGFGYFITKTGPSSSVRRKKRSRASRPLPDCASARARRARTSSTIRPYPG